MTALVGDFLIGVQPLWPREAISVADWFDRPTWERPTDDNGGDGDISVPDDFSDEGTPGFDGGEHDGYEDGDIGGTFEGGSFVGHEWSSTDGESGGGGGGGGGTLTIVLADGSVTSIAIEAHRRLFYRIEVYGQDGDKIATVPQWISAKLIRRLDTASTLTFRVAHDAEGAVHLVRPNSVWLRDRWGFVVDTFQIQRRRPMGRGDSSYYEIVAQGAISQLRGEVVLGYTGDAVGATVQDHVTALMDLQARDDALTLGTIDAEIGETVIPFFAIDTNIHAAILQLQAALPKAVRGRLYVDPKRRLQWRIVAGDTTEQVLTRGRNIYNIEAETDYDALVNRVYMYGEGQDVASRLSLVDAGEDEQYIEDTDSIAAWGLSPAIKVDRRIRYPETLLSVAQRILEDFAAPQVTVKLDLLDLAKADEAPAGWQDIDIGGRYRVVDSTLGIDTTVEIVGIETDLGRPVPVRVDLANQSKTLSDFISEIVDALQQPLDVDGELYDSMGRNYTEVEARAERAGDVRWNPGAGGSAGGIPGGGDGDPRGQMHDGTEWQDVGGGAGDADAVAVWYVEDTLDALPDDVEQTALGRVTTGADAGKVYIRDDLNTSWLEFAPVKLVLALPPIPSIGKSEVRWTSAGGGTGDDQNWIANAGDTKWTPTQRFSNKSGVPV